MTKHRTLLLLLALPLVCMADPGKDESGHGKRRGHDRKEYKEKYWDGNCEVERKVGKHGDYKEERKCRGHQHGEYRQAPVYQHEPVYVPAPHVPSGVTINGTIRLP